MRIKIFAFTLTLLTLLLVGCIQPTQIEGLKKNPYKTTPTPTPVVTPTPLLMTTPQPLITATPTPKKSQFSEETYCPLKIDMYTLKPYFIQGEIIEIRVSFVNTGKNTIMLYPFPPGIKILRKTSGRVKLEVKPGNISLELQPRHGETCTLKLSSSNLEPGFYVVKLQNFKVKTQKSSWILSPEIGEILIQYKQGALVMEMELNKTTISNEVAVSLKKVKFNEFGGKLEVIATLPRSFKPPSLGIPMPEPTPPPGKYEAYYEVDGEKKKAFSPSLRWIDKEYRQLSITWQIEPIRADAKGMKFIITQIGEWKGLWEFNLSFG